VIASTVLPVGSVNVGIIKAKGKAALFQAGFWVVMLSAVTILSLTHPPTEGWLAVISYAKLSVLKIVNP
jgi:hypothetical protein